MTKTPRPFDDLPAPQQASILAADSQFQRFAGARCVKSGIQFSPEAAAQFIRSYCAIDSRRDLTTNAVAAKKFQALRTDFDAWAGRIQSQR